MCHKNESDADNTMWSTPLAIAVHRDKLNMVLKLINAGANVDKTDHKDNTSLIVASWSRKEEICRALIRAGCNVNVKQPGGASVLYGVLDSIRGKSEADLEKIKLVTMLVKAGAVVGQPEEAVIQHVIDMMNGNLPEPPPPRMVSVAAIADAVEDLILALLNGKQPSLQQLSRLRVLKSLKSNKHLPKVIYSVPLPVKLQDCIAFCDV